MATWRGVGPNREAGAVTSRPRVSLIIPVHNEETLLAECLDSVLSQTVEDLEAICVNDASTDRSPEILAAYAARDPRVRVIQVEPNQGQGNARNLGMEAATGKYLFHLDSDDYLAPSAMEHLCGSADRDEADIVYGRSTLVDRSTGQRLTYRNDAKYVFTTVRRTTLNDFPALVYAHNTLNRVYRSAFLRDQAIRFGQETRWAEDVLFSLRANLGATSISTSMVPTYFYRFGGYLGNATPEKCYDARDNMIRGLRMVEEVGEAPLKREMQRKQATEASNLVRAARVFDRAGLLAYVESCQPMVTETSYGVLDSLPDYPRRFARALKAGDFEGALRAWERKDAQQPPPRWAATPWVVRLKPFVPVRVKDAAKRMLWRIRRG